MIKLLIGGSPCTHWSIAQTKNREKEPSGLGWELFKNYLIARDKYKPDYFLYENNKSMAPAIREQITKELGVEPILINSALVSAQNRQRLYWTNIPGVKQPEDLGILLRDILEPATEEKGYTLKTPGKPLSEREMEYMVRETSGGRNHFDFDYHHDATKPKSSCVTANTHRGVPYNVVAEPVCINPLASGKSRTVDAHMGKLENCLIPRMNNENPAKQQYDCIIEPVRIGTIENSAQNPKHDSQQYRVYSPDGKSVTLCGNGGGMGAKTGLYATPVRVGSLPNKDGELGNSQSRRIYSVDGKSVTLQARPNGGGADGAATGLYAIPTEQQINIMVETKDGKKYPIYEVRNGKITIKDSQYPIKLTDGFYIIRKLTVTECKRLQTVPESYVFPVSNTQAYKMLGNGWTVDVIAHILSYAPGITKQPLEVLSMYDGMSCGHLALDKLGGQITRYFATEIDEPAIQTTQHNYPDTIQLGDAFQVREPDWSLPATETGALV